MKKLLAVALVATFATAASAANLSLRFAGPNADNDTNATIPTPGGTVVVEVLWTTDFASDAATGLNQVAFNLTAVPESPAGGVQGDKVEDPGLFASGNLTSVANWVPGGAPGNVGSLGGQIQFGGPLAADSLFDAGTTVVGSFTITGLTEGLHTFYIQRNENQFSPDASTSAGGNWSFSNSPDDGYNEYSIGNGYAGNGNGSNSSPMNINVTPEPAALALLALGGIAVLRRRS